MTRRARKPVSVTVQRRVEDRFKPLERYVLETLEMRIYAAQLRGDSSIEILCTRCKGKGYVLDLNEDKDDCAFCDDINFVKIEFEPGAASNAIVARFAEEHRYQVVDLGYPRTIPLGELEGFDARMRARRLA